MIALLCFFLTLFTSPLKSIAPNPIFARHSYDCEGSELSVHSAAWFAADPRLYWRSRRARVGASWERYSSAKERLRPDTSKFALLPRRGQYGSRYSFSVESSYRDELPSIPRFRQASCRSARDRGIPSLPSANAVCGGGMP